MKNIIKRTGVVLSLVMCIVFAFTLSGCNDKYTDEDDYANFVRWQSRYETEKELIKLLRDYDTAYTTYKTYIEKKSTIHDGNSSIEFVFEGKTVLTDANIRLANIVPNEANEYLISIQFDSVGTAVFAEITANNIGNKLYIVQTKNGYSSLITSPTINAVITDGKAELNVDKGSFYDICLIIWDACAERNVQQAATAYNEQQVESAKSYSLSEYLPASLAVEPEYTDVSSYLQKAEQLGFIW